MIYIALILLLLPVSGWALEQKNGLLYGDPNTELCPEGRTCLSGKATEFEKRFSIMDSHAKILVDCTDERLASCKVDGLEELLACHQRMQEAFRNMKERMHPNPNSRSIIRGFTMTEDAWNQSLEPIYRDCVEGKP